MFSEPKLIDYSAVTLMKEEDVVKHPITFWVVSQEWNYPASNKSIAFPYE